MTETSKSVKTGGISTMGILGCIFVTLKLLHAIDWPWIWVLFPFWASFAALIIFLLVCGLLVGMLAILAKVVERFN